MEQKDLHKSWIKFVEFVERERFGEVKIKIQDGIPVCIPLQIIKRINLDGSVTTTEITKTINLT